MPEDSTQLSHELLADHEPELSAQRQLEQARGRPMRRDVRRDEHIRVENCPSHLLKPTTSSWGGGPPSALPMPGASPLPRSVRRAVPSWETPTTDPRRQRAPSRTPPTPSALRRLPRSW